MYEELKLKGDKTMDSNKYFIVRANRAGVFFGMTPPPDGIV